jgi:aminomethyltransferase
MIDFGGWDMPVYYTGINDEHRAVRSSAGVFDVSHMGQVEVSGPGAHDFLQRVLSNDLDRIGDGQAQYTLLTNDDGGIVDDLIAYRRGPDDYLLVVNAGNTDIDVAFLTLASDGVPVVDHSAAHGMIALQGPTSDDVLDGAVADIPSFGFATRTIAGIECLVARTGYTGERGVELVTPAAGTVAVWDHLLAAGAVPCGLGARDTLRLEVCYPLHGNDITPATNAIAAGLGWVCALAKDFTGVEVLRRTKEAGPATRLVAFRMAERAIPRGGMPILGPDGANIGVVTSGTLSPSLDEGIGMGYVQADHAAAGTAIVIDVRGRSRDAVVAAKPLLKKKES